MMPSDPAATTPSAATRHFPGFLSALLITMAAWFVAIVVAGLFGPRPDFGAIGIGQVVGFGLVAILATQRISAPQAERVGLRGVRRDFLFLLLFLLPAVVVLSELDNWIRIVFPVPSPSDAIESLPDTTLGIYGVIQRVIVIVGLAPVMEEWLFRGVIQQGLVGNLGRLRGVGLTALLFATAHLGPSAGSMHVLAYFAVAFASGVVLGMVRIATQSLLAAMLVHAGWNAISTAAIMFADRIPIAGFNVDATHTNVSIVFPCVIATAFALTGLVRASAKVPIAIPLPPPDDEED